jgi:hypothetical protein
VASVLINLSLLPIEDIPWLPKTAQEVLPAVTLILKLLQELWDSVFFLFRLLTWLLKHMCTYIFVFFY